MQPTRQTVLEAIDECRTRGERALLREVASGRYPKRYYLVHEGKRYPLKAIWAAAHRPKIHNRAFDTGDAKRGFEILGFCDFFPPWKSKHDGTPATTSADSATP